MQTGDRGYENQKNWKMVVCILRFRKEKCWYKGRKYREINFWIGFEKWKDSTDIKVGIWVKQGGEGYRKRLIKDAVRFEGWNDRWERGVENGKNRKEGFGRRGEKVRYKGSEKVVCGVSYSLSILLKKLYNLSKLGGGYT